MNRKGDLFMLGLNVIFLIALIYLFWKVSVEFEPDNPLEGVGTRQIALLNTYGTAEEILLEIDLAARNAALEAYASLPWNGVIDLSACGQYAGYVLWNNEEKECYADRDTLTSRYEREIVRVLPSFLSVPTLISYEITATLQKDSISIVGRTQDRIVLPIISIKDASQKNAASIVKSQRGVGVGLNEFDPESSVVKRVFASSRTVARQVAPDSVVIANSGDQLGETLERVKTGSLAMQYLVQKNGVVIQLLPENIQPILTECTLTACQGNTILVLLENQGNTCEDTPCWDPVTDTQIESLKLLLGDIVRRDAIKPENIYAKSSDDPGRAFTERTGGMGVFLSDVLKYSTESRTTENADTSNPTQAIHTFWPIEQGVIGPCWGKQLDGEDQTQQYTTITSEKSSKVFAPADGVVTCVGKCGRDTLELKLDLGNELVVTLEGFSSFDQSITKGKYVTANTFVGTTDQIMHMSLSVKENALDPLCLFDDQTLSSLLPSDPSCLGYASRTELTRANPAFALRCADIPQVRGQTSCDINDVQLHSTGNAGTNKVRERLIEMDLMSEIETSASNAGIDPLLVEAIIAHETGGTADPSMVNEGGDLGIAQFSPVGARDEIKIFVSQPIEDCKCRVGSDPPGLLPRTCDASKMPVCGKDPRLDRVKSVRASASHLGKGFTAFDGLSDRLEFTIASYNAGIGGVQSAIKKTGKRDPSFAEVRQYLPTITQGYVPSVLDYYRSLGGSDGRSFEDQTCSDLHVTLKELGRYEFTPSFRTEVPDVLSPLLELSTWADKTVKECDGRNGQDTRACLARRENEFSNPSITIISCDDAEQNSYIEKKLRMVATDCSENKQTECTCPFHVGEVSENVRIDLYDDEARVFVDGNPVNPQPSGLPLGLFLPAASKEPESVPLSLIKEDGLSIQTWDQEFPYSKTDTKHKVSEFLITKRDNLVMWTADPENLPACGIYKTKHQICARLKTTTYDGGTGKTVYPVVRFALTLNDAVPPLAVSSAKAVTPASLLDVLAPGAGTAISATIALPIVVSFAQSQSDDASYYIISCPGAANTKVLGREIQEDGSDKKLTDPLRVTIRCKAIVGTPIVITPYDISGNKGLPTTVLVSESDTFTPEEISALELTPEEVEPLPVDTVQIPEELPTESSQTPNIEITTSSSKAASLAREELKIFGYGSITECDPKVKARVMGFFSDGLCPAEATCDGTAWSAAFVSSVMKRAEVNFPLACAHFVYFTKSRDSSGKYACEARPPNRAGDIKVGDVVCQCRDKSCPMTFSDPSKGQLTHCDIVTSRSADTIEVIGGNLQNSVRKKTLTISEISQAPYFGYLSCS